MLDTKIFLQAIEEIEARGISREVTINALKDAFAAIFANKAYEECRVQVDIQPEKGVINLYLIKKVVEEVEDDALQVQYDEVCDKNPSIKIGDDYYEQIFIDDLTKAEANKFKSILKQKIKEAEKKAIYEAYADKEGELISGVVEKIEPNYVSLNIGRVTVFLNNKHKIGDEQFQIGQIVKVHLSKVESSTSGTQINVSRADAGFLKRLFEEEISEVFDGTIEIVDIARQAGERSKVSVVTKDPNVDPVGACIGASGQKIKNICQQIGKEKIDIVKYHKLPALFIAEALKPANVLGVSVNEEAKQAVAVVKDGDLRVAIGKKGINVILAVKLTGWKIDIKEVTTALEEGIIYETIDALEAREQREAILASHDEVEVSEEAPEEEVNEVEVAPVETPVEEEKVEEIKETPVETPKEEEKVVEEVKPAPVKEEVKFEDEKVEIKNSAKVSLESLEKQIEEEKKRKNAQPKPSYKKQDKQDKEEKEEKEKIDRSSYLEVEYTDEELREIEEAELEDEETYDDDIDYSDFDKYYEE